MPAVTGILPAAQAGTVTLGGDLTINRMGYGAMRITGKGIWGPPADREGALATLRRAVELGVNFIDTADSYGPDVSEELIAEALYPYPKDLVITTKVGWVRHGPGVWQHNSSPAHIKQAIEGSLKRLRMERIDVYQLHTPDPAASFDASMEALAELQAQGKIRHIALSNVTLEHIKRAQKMVPIVSVPLMKLGPPESPLHAPDAVFRYKSAVAVRCPGVIFTSLKNRGPMVKVLALLKLLMP